MAENLWTEAVLTALYIRNRAPTKLIAAKTPFKMYTGFKPSVGHFRIFGSTAVALEKIWKNKFQTKGKKFKTVGYSLTSKAYRLFDPETKNVVERRDVYFDESEDANIIEPKEKNNNMDASKFLIELNIEEDSGDIENNCGEQNANDVNNEEEPQKPTTDSGNPMVLRTGKKVYNTVNALQEVTDIYIPSSITDTLNNKYKNEWKKAKYKHGFFV